MALIWRFVRESALCSHDQSYRPVLEATRNSSYLGSDVLSKTPQLLLQVDLLLAFEPPPFPILTCESSLAFTLTPHQCFQVQPDGIFAKPIESVLELSLLRILIDAP